jgi:hypothetical protein
MRRLGALLPIAAALGCYDWTVPVAPPLDAGGADATPPPTGLVAWWGFEEDTAVVDRSGNGNDGVSNGGVGRTPRAAGKAATFNGVDGFIHVADNGTLTFTSGFTIALWMNLDDAGYDQRVVVPFQNWQLKINGLRPQISVADGYANLDVTVELGSWHHVAFTYDAGNVIGYYDGKPLRLSENTFVRVAQNPQITSGELNIGGSYQASLPPAKRTEIPYFVKGALDEIRIYHRPLGADEIARVYAGD